MKNCPICGKHFVVTWPEFWCWRRGETFFCSEQCLDVSVYRDTNMIRQIHMKRGNKHMQSANKERYMEAVRIHLEGGDVKAYLKKIGSNAPDKLWYYIKTQLKKSDPELYAKIQDGRKKQPEKEKKEKKAPKATAPAKIETPEANRAEVIETPETPRNRYDDFTVQAIKGDYGRYSRSSCSGTEYLDFTSNNGEELTMPISAWRDFLDELHRAAKVLGVDL